MTSTTNIPALNETAYTRYMRAVGLASKAVGLKLNLRGAKEHLKTGDIFIFNHFTRFETAVPPFLIYTETGAIARSVGHHSLFRLAQGFTNFLYDVGGVPSDMPGLLPYLAAEILRGRKVVIFPEGGLVKDKQIFDERGDYGILSSSASKPRKHHRGAAVLATYLDVLKTYLRDADSRADSETLTHWQQALQLPDLAALRSAIAAPTRIVPSTLTFFPIRNEANLFTNLAESLMGDLSDIARDEITLETNLLLRPTDLDVWVGQPLESGWAPPKAEVFLWRHALRRVRSLDELFELDLGSAGWMRRPLEQRLNSAVHRLRDRAMRALYGGLTVNIHHVLATLVQEYLAAGRHAVPEAEFENALVQAVHRLQQQAAKHASLPLHHSIASAQSLYRLALGRHMEARNFLEVLRRAKLVKHKGGRYHLSHALSDAFGRDEIRLENPVRLHANEAAVQPAVGLTVRWAIQQAGATQTLSGKSDWAGLMLHIQRAAMATQHRNAGAEALEAGAAAVAPCLKKPTEANGVGVLLLHGLGASPAQMKPLAADLAALGYTVHAPTLPGHGSRPADLDGITEHDWLAAARLGLRVLQGYGVNTVHVVGFSTGALVGLQLAAEQPEGLGRVVAVAPPMKLVSPLRHLHYLAMTLNALVAPTLGRLVPLLQRGVVPWYRMTPAQPAEQYDRVPLSAVAALRRMARQVWRGAGRLKTPVTLLHGSADGTAAFHASKQFATQRLAGAQFLVLRGAGHDVVRTNTAHSWAHIIKALEDTDAKR